MTAADNPFAKPTAAPGQGQAVLRLLAPGQQVLNTFQYQYPLKLIAPDPHYVNSVHATASKLSAGGVPESGTKGTTVQEQAAVTTIFLLTYGGGLLARDAIHLKMELNPSTRLALLTQGSTKIFKADPIHPNTPSCQTLDVTIEDGASLCYLPDPCQPFEGSVFEQTQSFYVRPQANLLMLDWVSEGRKARGETWKLKSWKGKNEVRLASDISQNGEVDTESRAGRLLLRDSILLQDDAGQLDKHLSLENKMGGAGIIGTVIIYGPMFQALREFWMKEFRALPRIGAKSWAGQGGRSQNGYEEEQAMPGGRAGTAEGLLWTAAEVRGGFVLVKFSAVELDVARQWLGRMLRKEGTLEREFGHQALLCLK